MPTAEPPQKCICQICTCGRHRCPHRPGTTALPMANGSPSNLVSEYHERYKDNELAKREPLLRAKDNLGLAADRLEDATTSRTDYVPQKTTRAMALRNADNLRPEGDLDLSTVYKREYDGKQTQREAPILNRTDNLMNSSAKFDALPSYKEDFPIWPIGRPQRVKRSDALQQSTEPFEGNTTQRSSYVVQPATKATYNRPRTTTKWEGNFDGTSTLHDDYKPWEVSRPDRRRPDDFIRASGNLDLNTTNRLDFKENKAVRTKANRPPTATKIDGDFDPGTTHRETFKGLPGERQPNFKPTDQLQSSEPFEGFTTSRTDYTEKAGSRTRVQRPLTATKFTGDFLKETTNKSDYQPWTAQRPEVHRISDGIRTEGDMDLSTVMRTDYGDAKGERSKQIRPPTSQKYTGDFEDKTSHKVDFPGWKADRPLAANKVEYKPPSGKFEGQTTNKSDFVTLQASSRAKPFKHPTTSLFDPSPIDGTTSYRSEYVTHLIGGCPAEGLSGNGTGNENYRFRTQIGGHHFYRPISPAR